jgi:hypothetical protein
MPMAWHWLQQFLRRAGAAVAWGAPKGEQAKVAEAALAPLSPLTDRARAAGSACASDEAAVADRARPALGERVEAARGNAAYADLRLVPTGPGRVEIRWSVEMAAWARLDAEFPGSAGVTRPMLRVGLVASNGQTQEVLGKELENPTAACDGVLVVPNCRPGEYEAELGLATDDGGWLMLVRSARQQLSRPAARGRTEAQPSPPASAAHEPDRPSTRRWLQQPPRPDEAERSAAARGVERRSVLPSEGGGAATAPPPFQPSGWGLLPEGLGASPEEPAERSGSRPVAASGEEAPALLPPHWGRGPAAAGYGVASNAPGALQVRAEVLIYGSGPPGAVVDLYGRSLTIGPGGAFSLRFAITDPDLLRRALAQAPPLAPGAEGPLVDGVAR